MEDLTRLSIFMSVETKKDFDARMRRVFGKLRGRKNDIYTRFLMEGLRRHEDAVLKREIKMEKDNER